MLSNHKRTLAGLATALVAVGVAVGSGATFSSATANPANTFSSGTFTHTNSKNGAAILTGTKMIPGDSKTGTVTITNTGDVSGKFKLAESNDTNGFTAGSLDLKIEDVTGTPQQLYLGDLGSVADIDLGTFAKDEARTYKFTVTLDSSAGNVDQGKSATADYNWTAVQS
jgi:spore coat-associated protein N